MSFPSTLLIYIQGQIKGQACQEAAHGANLQAALTRHWNKSEICRTFEQIFKEYQF
jgi:hypothetical protein